MRRIVQALLAVAAAIALIAAVSAGPTPAAAAPEAPEIVAGVAAAPTPSAWLICSYWEESEMFQPVYVVSTSEIYAWNAVGCHFHWLVAGLCFHSNGVYDRDTGAHQQVGVRGDTDGNPWSNCSFGTHLI